jgi:hypothetical protein
MVSVTDRISDTLGDCLSETFSDCLSETLGDCLSETLSYCLSHSDTLSNRCLRVSVTQSVTLSAIVLVTFSNCLRLAESRGRRIYHADYDELSQA